MFNLKGLRMIKSLEIHVKNRILIDMMMIMNNLSTSEL